MNNPDCDHCGAPNAATRRVRHHHDGAYNLCDMCAHTFFNSREGDDLGPVHGDTPESFDKPDATDPDLIETIAKEIFISMKWMWNAAPGGKVSSLPTWQNKGNSLVQIECRRCAIRILNTIK